MGNVHVDFSEMQILPPKPGVCKECAVQHSPNQPHNPDSLYYQMKFRQKHGRFPTWADAMAHCEEHVKKKWINMLADHGVVVELPEAKTDGNTR